MRILHTADLHLGRQFNTLSLEPDHQHILDQILQALITHNPDVFIIAGDIFDRAAPPASAVRQFNAFLSRVAGETRAIVVMIAGNHDSGDRIGAMAVMTDARRALVRGPLSAAEPPLLLADAHGPVAISALPFGYEYAARECFGDETISTPEDVLRAQVGAARAMVPPGARWVVVAHAFVSGAQPSEGERPLARVGGIETVPAEVFGDAVYVALGHLHRPQAVGVAHIRYSGSPLAFGFDEAAETKSMTLIDLGPDGPVSVTPIPFVPLRGVRLLRGRLSDLLLAPPSEDFVKAILTDEAPQIDPMRRLRDVFPNACQIVYARDERATPTGALAQAPLAMADPAQVADEFLRLVRGEAASALEQVLIADALHDLRRAESVA